MRLLKRTKLLVPVAVVCLLGTAAASERTVIDNERGQYYGYADGSVFSGLGALLLNPHDGFFGEMTAESLKLPHGHVQHVAPSKTADDWPYLALKSYEANEVRLGRPPILVTATYQGAKKPVYFNWSLALSSLLRPTAPQIAWAQAVNVQDDRYIKFFANVYLRQTMWQPFYDNYWLGADNGAFNYGLYGVLNDRGKYVGGVTWDPPFAQSDSQFLDTIKYFFQRIKVLARDVHIMVNGGSMSDESRFADVWGTIDGLIAEDLTQSFQGDAASRNGLYRDYTRLTYLGPLGKTCLLRVLLPAASTPAFPDEIRTGYAAYLIVRGENFFFGPRFDDGTVLEVLPSDYADMKDALGAPTGPSASDSSTNDGYRLYWRPTEGGIVFLNWTGASQTIDLAGGPQYYDRTGNPVAGLTIPDLRGDYVVLTPGARAEKSAINPRWPGSVAGPLAVSLSNIASGATIRYTLDGSEPTASSPVYTGPITLNSSAVVKAKSFVSGSLDSFTASASYTITSTQPTVGYYVTADSGTKAFPAVYPLVQVNNVSGQPVTVDYAVTGGTAVAGVDYKLSNGALTFNPSDQYRSFPITMINRSASTADKTIVVSLSNPTNATLGANSVYTYTITQHPGASPTTR